MGSFGIFGFAALRIAPASTSYAQATPYFQELPQPSHSHVAHPVNQVRLRDRRKRIAAHLTLRRGGFASTPEASSLMNRSPSTPSPRSSDARPLSIRSRRS